MSKTDQLPKPRIMISACLLGDTVRYDGKTKQHDLIIRFFSLHSELIKVCPEVGAGLSVPRPPVQLVENNGQIHALGVEDRTLDVTDALNHYAQHICQQPAPHAVILKSRSPSCGHGSTPIFNTQREMMNTDSGLFSATVKRLWPHTLLVEDEALQTEDDCHHLLSTCYQRMQAI